MKLFGKGLAALSVSMLVVLASSATASTITDVEPTGVAVDFSVPNSITASATNSPTGDISSTDPDDWIAVSVNSASTTIWGGFKLSVVLTPGYTLDHGDFVITKEGTDWLAGTLTGFVIDAGGPGFGNAGQTYTMTFDKTFPTDASLDFGRSGSIILADYGSGNATVDVKAAPVAAPTPAVASSGFALIGCVMAARRRRRASAMGL